jgi:hypothetical protein
MKRLAAVLITASLAGLAGAPAAAHADFGIEAHSVLAKTHATVALTVITPPLSEETFNRQIDLAAIEAAPPLTQAGAHPDATVAFTLNHAGTGIGAAPEEEVKDLTVNLPPGLIGDPEAVPACGREAFQRTFFTSAEPVPLSNGCPQASQVGVAMLSLHDVERPETVPVYRIAATNGYPASFGMPVAGFGIILNARLRSDGDYGVAVEVSDIAASPAPWSSAVTFWGVPADPTHDPERWNGETQSWGVSLNGTEVKPLLSSPTWCESGPLTTGIADVDSWQNPGHFLPENALDPNYLAESPQPTGCEGLRFGGAGAEAALTFQPDIHAAETPSAYEAKLTLPYNEGPEALATPTLRDTTVTLPEGVVVNPAGANGLGVCSEEQIGYVGSGFPLPQPVHFTGEAASCPSDSKIGTVEVHTPLLDHVLKGAVYVASEGENPFGSLLAIYIAVYDPETGIVVKLAGEVTPNPQTGQLTATFTNNPQLPFTELDLSFFGGAQATLATPATCGTFTTSSLLTPWSAPQTPVVTSTDSFKIEGGPNDSGCVSGEAQQPNSPSLEAGTVNPAAGAYSPFAMHLSRSDGSQRLKAVDVTLPPGLAGKIAGVQQCPDSAIALAKSREGVLGDGALEQSSPSCPTGSLLGTATVTAGVGPDPYPVSGNVYFAGPYEGAPFSLVIVTPAVAGPFDLGTVVVRAALFIDQHTAQVTVTSDPIPSILRGIPLDIRSIDVNMTRSDFTFNPTSCEPMSVNGTVQSLQGTSATVSDRFQAADCASIAFKPSFTASTQAKTSKANGASLVVELAQKPGEANIHKVDLQLPLALPSRLTTLQKACGEAQFAADPAGCPAGSVIGTTTAHTPLLQVPLTGPAYLVSHGGAAFPDVEFVLQADERGGDVEIVLDGKTQIKKGITYSHFETVPDAPISSFETILPEGPHSALAAYGNLCTQSLVMPTTLVGQNGAEVKQSTKIAVAGCKAVTISKRKLSRKDVVLTFFLTTKGTVTVTAGDGLRGYRQTLSAGSHQVEVALSNAWLSMRKRRTKIKIKVALRSGTQVSSATTTLKL